MRRWRVDNVTCVCGTSPVDVNAGSALFAEVNEPFEKFGRLLQQNSGGDRRYAATDERDRRRLCCCSRRRVLVAGGDVPVEQRANVAA